MTAGGSPSREPSQTTSAEELVDRAREARGRAYAPYSGFAVGAALRSADGQVVLGVNVENAASPAGICAERAALAAAVSRGLRDFDAIAVAAGGSEACLPCGTCLQSLAEFAPGLEVLAAGESGEAVRYVLNRDLLPHPFGR